MSELEMICKARNKDLELIAMSMEKNATTKAEFTAAKAVRSLMFSPPPQRMEG